MPRVARKTSANSPVPAKRPQPHGGALNVGNPGNKGGTGRPRNEHRAFVRQLLADPKADKALRRVLTDDTHRHYAAVLKAVTEFAYKPPPATVRVAGHDGGPLAVDVTDLRAKLAERLARLAAEAERN
jgi:predicted N-acetyltransferase YhbS